MNAKSSEFNALVKAIEYYKRLLTDERRSELPKDHEKVFWDADIAIADMRKRRDADNKRTAANVARHREANPLYGRPKKPEGEIRKVGRPKKTEDPNYGNLKRKKKTEENRVRPGEREGKMNETIRKKLTMSEEKTLDYILDGGHYDAVVELMDDEIREELHNEIAPCADEVFLAEYLIRHREKFGEEFTFN